MKPRLVFGQLHGGETLTVLFDKPGRRNVPVSVRKDGHQVASVAPDGSHWRLVIQKA